jgi:hypothetical protein
VTAEDTLRQVVAQMDEFDRDRRLRKLQADYEEVSKRLRRRRTFGEFLFWAGVISACVLITLMLIVLVEGPR